ncbi:MULTISPECIES: lipopolysaccharide assembly protein LapA domain-containing protein [Microvirga]|uniref:lipopolysaccharide assembly protein LapA domain-containing protein n=1 Tax=Microvirga TaxID=186650 RepID=UPI001CFFF5A5|nr:lipopolysaccharide assembly protein LapA domain-containing protein [Microvirga lenta]MCB5174945.1 lipopolysaccharide assembly protein LapA domain-containing protein [Microvirga lenta]
MIRFLKALILLPVAILVVLLAVANRAPVTLSFDPFSDVPEFSAELPLFAVIFAAVALGVVIGGTASWLAQGRNRKERRRFRREARTLRHETERLRTQNQTTTTGPAALPRPQASAY